jgi:hypothetical protein
MAPYPIIMQKGGLETGAITAETPLVTNYQQITRINQH